MNQPSDQTDPSNEQPPRAPDGMGVQGYELEQREERPQTVYSPPLVVVEEVVPVSAPDPDEAATPTVAPAGALAEPADPYDGALSPLAAGVHGGVWAAIGPRVLLAVGSLLLLGAVALGVYNMGPAPVPEGTSPTLAELPSWWHRIGRGVVVLLTGAIHAGTGLVAAYATSRVLGLKLGPIDLTLARVFVAVAGFLAVFNLSIPIPFVGGVLKVALAAGVYWGALVLLLRRIDRVHLLLSVHAGVATLLYAHMWMWAKVLPFVQR
jgi:hypothetical protein